MSRLWSAAPSWSLGLIFLLVFGGALVLAFELPERARLFPIFVITVGMILVLVEAVFAVVRPLDANADSGLDLRADDEHGFQAALRAGAPTFAWIAGALFTVLLIGPSVAVPSWLAIYLLAVVKQSIAQMAATVGIFIVVTVGLFDYLLQVPWPVGALPDIQNGIQAIFQSWGV